MINSTRKPAICHGYLAITHCRS